MSRLLNRLVTEIRLRYYVYVLRLNDDEIDRRMGTEEVTRLVNRHYCI